MYYFNTQKAAIGLKNLDLSKADNCFAIKVVDQH
jgi:hypothetical protein